MTAGLSVLICCYNSASRLPETLMHLAEQQVPESISWEVIVVDNASDDDTARVATDTWNSFTNTNIKFTLLTEPKAGKNNALHTGITASAYDYILICDDDNWLNPNYIAKAYQRMQSDASIGATGGKGIAVTDETLPAWFSNYQHGYAVGEQNPGTGDVSDKKYLWGAGMIFRKSIYNKAYTGFPSFLTGPNANTLARGEDVEFCMRIILAGYKLFYDEALIYRHYIPSERLTEAYRDKLFKGYDYEKQVLDLYSRQLEINKLSRPAKLKLLAASLLRYAISRVKPSGKWNSRFEAGIAHLIAGYEFAEVANEVKQIRMLNLQLAHTAPANA